MQRSTLLILVKLLAFLLNKYFVSKLVLSKLWLTLLLLTIQSIRITALFGTLFLALVVLVLCLLPHIVKVAFASLLTVCIVILSCMLAQTFLLVYRLFSLHSNVLSELKSLSLISFTAHLVLLSLNLDHVSFFRPVSSFACLQLLLSIGALLIEVCFKSCL